MRNHKALRSTTVGGLFKSDTFCRTAEKKLSLCPEGLPLLPLRHHHRRRCRSSRRIQLIQTRSALFPCARKSGAVSPQFL